MCCIATYLGHLGADRPARRSTPAGLATRTGTLSRSRAADHPRLFVITSLRSPLVDPERFTDSAAQRPKSLEIGRADARTRTGDPFITSEVLYQLSYVGEAGSV